MHWVDLTTLAELIRWEKCNQQCPIDHLVSEALWDLNYWVCSIICLQLAINENAFPCLLSKKPTNGQNLLLDIISLPSPHFPSGVIPHRKLGNCQVIVFFLNSVWAESLHFLLYFHVLWIIVMHRNNPKNKYIFVFNDMDNLKKGASSRFEKKWTNQTNTNTKQLCKSFCHLYFHNSRASLLLL